MSSKYPNKLDTNIELPSVEDNLTEMGGEAINGLREAVFNIEETLGINPQGSSTDVVSRLNQSLNADGTIKSSAFSVAGLLTAPIVNDDVAPNAAIEESKLDLDYSTAQLKTWFDLGISRIDFLSNGLTDLFSKVTRHVAHPGTWGRHETRDIDGYTGKYASSNLQGIISYLDENLFGHIDDVDGAHTASSISVDDSKFLYPAENAQEALDYLNDIGKYNIIQHRDYEHDNGILSKQEVVLPGSKRSVVIVDSFPLYNIGVGESQVRFTAPPVNFGQIMRGDVIGITTVNKTYYYNISRTDTSTNVVRFVGQLVEGGAASAIVYRTTEETSAVSVLKTVILRDPELSAGGHVLKVINPNAPFVMSINSRPWTLSSSASQIALRWSLGETVLTGINIKDAMQTSLGAQPSAWTIEGCVGVLNQEFIARDMPIVAFEHRGEIGIVYDNVDGYVEILGPSSNSAWSALGFSEGEKSYGLGKRKFYIDGYEYSDIRCLVEATGDVDNSSIIKNIDKDLLQYSVLSRGSVKVTPTSGNYSNTTVIEKEGSLFFSDRTSNTLTVSSSILAALDAQPVNLKIYADTFIVPSTTSKRTLFEVFLDGYEAPFASVRGVPRVEYYNCQDKRPNNPESWFDIVAVSRNFTNSRKRIYYDGNRQVMFGDRAVGGEVINYGNVITLPLENSDGYSFRLYDDTNINYIDLVVSSSMYTNVDVISNANSIDVDIFNRISEERYLQIATVLYDRTKLNHLQDTRIFGTTGRKSVSDDFKRDYILYPRSVLRGNGVIRGMEVGEDTSSVKASINIKGGEVLVNGSIITIPKTNLFIPLDTENRTYNIFVDSDGVIQILQNDSTVGGFTPSLAEIINSPNKLILAQVSYVASTQAISLIKDYRRFVGNIDGKIDLFVGESGHEEGSFLSLQAAVNYLNAQYSDYLGSKTLKIKGNNTYDLSYGPLYLPDGVILEGDSYTNSFGEYFGSKITLSGSGTVFIVPGKNCAINNILIEGEEDCSCDAVFGESFNLSGGGAQSLEINGLKLISCGIQNLKAKMIFVCKTITDFLVKDCYFEVIDASSILSGLADFAGIAFYAENFKNTIIENNVCCGYDGKSILSFISSNPETGSAENVFVSKNKIVSEGLLGAGFSAIGLVNCKNTHIEENSFVFEDVKSNFRTILSGVINITGEVIGSSINENYIVYKNNVSQDDFWDGAVSDLESSDYTFALGTIISVNSISQMIEIENIGAGKISNLEIKGNYIKGMCLVSAIGVGIVDEDSSNIIIQGNVIDKGSYLVMAGISVETLNSSQLPVVDGIYVKDNYIYNSIKINFSDGKYSYLLNRLHLPEGLVSIAGIDVSGSFEYGYYNNVFVSKNTLINEVSVNGIPNGINIGRVNGLFLEENLIKNCSVDISGISSHSIIVDGVNNCNVEKNTIEGCGKAIRINNNSVDSILFNSDCNISNNIISSSKYGENGVSVGAAIVSVVGMAGEIKIKENKITASEVNRDELIYIENCVGFNNILNNNFETLGAITTEDGIFILTTEEDRCEYTTNITGNNFLFGGQNLYGAIRVRVNSENSPVKNINISENIISGPLYREAIILYCMNASSSMSNVKINNNIVNNTIDVDPAHVDNGKIRLLPHGDLSTFYNIDIFGNVVSGRGTAIHIRKGNGLNIKNNQILTEREILGPSEYGIYCKDSRKVNIVENNISDYACPIWCNGSVNDGSNRAYFSIINNNVVNEKVKTEKALRLYGVIENSIISLMENTIIKNFIDTTSPSENVLISFELPSNLNTTVISHNNLFNISGGISGGSGLKSAIYVNGTGSGDFRSLSIIDNRLVMLGDMEYGIYVGDGIIRNTTISGNTMTGSFLGHGVMVSATYCYNLIIEGNSSYNINPISSSVLQTATVYVDLTNDSQVVSILNNNFINAASDVKGNYFGIFVNAGSSIDTLNICNNSLNYFNNVLSSGICCNGNITNFVFSNNNVCESSYGLLFNAIGSCETGIISGNNILVGKDPLLFGGTGDFSYSYVNIIGNNFTSTSSTRTTPLVALDCSGFGGLYFLLGNDVVVSNNIFNSQHTSADATGKLLLIFDTGNGCFVSNNKFIANETFLNSTFPIQIVSLNEDSVCAFNNLRETIIDSVDYTLPKIYVTGTNLLNFGENYVVSLSLNNFIQPTVFDLPNYVLTSSWITFSPDPNFINFSYYSDNASYNILATQLQGVFDESLVPSNAQIKAVVVVYVLSGAGADTAMDVAWLKRDSIISPFTHVLPGGNYISLPTGVYYTLEPSSFLKMGQGAEHRIVFRPTGTGTYQFLLTGASIIYTL